MPAPLIPAAIATAGKFLPSLGAIGKLLFSKKVLAAPLALEGLQILGGTKSLGQSGKDFLIDVGLSATGLAGLQKAKALGKLPKMLQGKVAEDLLVGGVSLLGVPPVSSAVDSVLGIGNRPSTDIQQSPGSLNPANLNMTSVPQASATNASLVPGGDPTKDTLAGTVVNDLMNDLLQQAYGGGNRVVDITNVPDFDTSFQPSQLGFGSFGSFT